MRSYSSAFFDVGRFTSDVCHSTNSPKKRLVEALMLVLTLCQLALMVAHEVMGISVLNLCAEILDGINSKIENIYCP